MSASRHTARRQFIRFTILFALLHYGVLLLLKLVITVAAAVPPSLANTDRLLIALSSIHQGLCAVRTVLRWLWPAESVPVVVNFAFTVFNSVAWGAACAFIKVRLR